ncbi:T9SS type A sorting domain-containing protein [Marivirga salinae]|uniref:T9SS type A sorting domain-containing protein n=1 Tax=Marivirga salinarum TaxID=3059078 RepID=A0AA51NA80_9BACT|nr:T9SS type A sorting domain-containing protein [Marivirga sp. BDSF4-3]WMN11413.1 T9SS type A sorting domain-containing protein [Marivirga sp. BDSF4-3]
MLFYGQITESPIGHLYKKNSNIQMRLSVSQDTISMPIWDDFTYNSQEPDSNIWLHGEHVFVNNGFAYLPPSFNVATLDGFDGNGIAYNTEENANGIGDSLVSKPIDLSAYDENSNINLSFFWQEGFGGNAPDAQDSLKLSFRNAEGEWILVHGFGGSGNIERTLFSQHFERVNDSSFLHAGFQFKFESAGSLAGDFDTWNLDYIYLNAGNTPVNTQGNAYDSYEDRTFSEKPKSPFADYYALPLKHLNESWLEENIDTATFIYNNLWAGNANNFSFGTEFFSTVYDTLKPNQIIDSLEVDGVFLTDLQDTAQFIYHPENKSQFINHLLSEKENEDSVYLNFQFNLGTNDSLFFETIDGVAVYYPELSFRQNDTVSTIIPLHDYYAFDDGSAESRVQLNSRNYQLAQSFDVIGEQFLTGIEIYAPNIGQNASTQNITLLVWNNLTSNTDDILRAQNVLINQSVSLNQFQRFTFDRPILLSGEFFIGYREENDAPLSIGFDKNTNSATRLFYNQGGDWEPNITLEGSVMIRPVFDTKEIQVSNDKRINPKLDIKAYPNPSRGVLKFTKQVDQIEIYDLQGSLKVSETNIESSQSIDISHLPNNLYLIKLRKGNQYSTLKVMLRK